MKKKSVALLMALVLVFGVAVGGTVAWLMDRTEAVVNTFTVGDIEIELYETDADGNEVWNQNFKVIPGTDIAKDPTVEVKAGSEACWLFVTIEEENWNANLTYGIAAGWTKLQDGVYYREVAATDADTPFYVLKGNEKNHSGVVIVSDKLAAGEITASPTLTFTAYAIQSENIADAAAAWTAIKASA